MNKTALTILSLVAVLSMIVLECFARSTSDQPKSHSGTKSRPANSTAIARR